MDHSFVLGRLWDTENVFVATGFNSQGIQTAPGVGLALTEWMLDGSRGVLFLRAHLFPWHRPDWTKR